ncbi:flagellar motor switch protein FliG [Spirochaeta dissipatitropha]
MKMESRRMQAYSKGTPGASSQEDKNLSKETVKPESGKTVSSSTIKPSALQGLLKMVSDKGAKDKFAQVATFLMLIGQEESAKILRCLPHDIVERLSAEIVKSRYIPRSEARTILERFERIQEHDDGRIIGGVDTAQTMLVQAFGTEKGQELLYRAVPDARPNRFSFLQDIDYQQLKILLKDESVAVVAIVLYSLPAKQASKLLSQYDTEKRMQLARRIARSGKVDSAVLDRVAEKLKELIREHSHVRSEEIDGSSRLAAILKHGDVRTEERILRDLGVLNPEISERVKGHLFTIDTVLEIEDRDLQKVLQDFADTEIALLLKGKEQSIREKILRNVSAGRQELISMEYTHLGAQLRSEVDAASRDFISHLRKLEEEGKIRIHRPDDKWVT